MREHFYVTKSDEGWVGRREGKNHPMVKGSTKKEVVSEMIRVAKHHQPSSLRIQKMNGKFQEERTYPRTSDPSTSRG
jgi:hypothetical protein